VFGKRPLHAAPDPAELACAHDGLNPSQLAAVRLALASRVSFVWGPPGTGKTETLGHIVEELAAAGRRVLVASTTNAAVDQALAKLAVRETMMPLFEKGSIVRMGRTDAPTFGAELHEAVERAGADIDARIGELTRERDDAARRGSIAEGLGQRIRTGMAAVQRELFGDPPSMDVKRSEAREVLPAEELEGFLAMAAASRRDRLAAAEAEWKARTTEAEAGIARLREERSARAAAVISRASVILATLATLAVSGSLGKERFDTVVVEEAGMAVLPAVFHCASLARRSVILIGDPRQLPPIVQSSDPYVRRAMGRSIFDVTVPDPLASPCVALLDVQYRMHPDIGNLVSSLYYDGALKHGAEDREAIAAARPCPGRPLVLVDSGGWGECRTAEGSFSRCNERTAALCVAVAEAMERDGIDSIAVITPYVEQARIVRKGLAGHGLRSVECRTVHRFQGNERDTVILDAVDAEPFSPGVLLAGTRPGSSAENLLNVSVSRARGKLVVIADVSFFEGRAPGSPMARLLGEMRSRGATLSAAEAERHCTG
jgi:superfamily I DNA and/or RNA helicase